MSKFGFSDIKSEFIHSALIKTIKNEIQSDTYVIEIKSASQAGYSNFNGIVHRVYFENGDVIDKERRSSSLILKVAPRNTARRNQFSARPCFLREIYLYDMILPYFRVFEESKDVVIEENGFIEYPKCYRTIDVELDECLMLEDLKIRGFEMIDRHTDKVTLDHVRLYLQALAKYHAVSFALKDQQPQMFNEMTSDLVENFIRRDIAPMREYYTYHSEIIINLVAANEDDHFLLSKVKKFFAKDALDVIVDCIEAESTEATAVISYGDANRNNLMFRYDNNKKPIEICLIDWQASRIASPITDIVYFIFSCTTKELRDSHYDDLLEMYHNSLSAHIRRLGSDPEQLFPYEMMLKHLHKFSKFGLMMASLILSIHTADDGPPVNLDEVAENFENGKQIDTNPFCGNKPNSKYNKRMRDVVIDMVRLEYI